MNEDFFGVDIDAMKRKYGITGENPKLITKDLATALVCDILYELVDGPKVYELYCEAFKKCVNESEFESEDCHFDAIWWDLEQNDVIEWKPDWDKCDHVTWDRYKRQPIIDDYFEPIEFREMVEWLKSGEKEGELRQPNRFVTFGDHLEQDLKEDPNEDPDEIHIPF